MPNPTVARLSRWAAPALLALVAWAFDMGKRRVEFGLLSTGLLDEVAHFAAAALGLMVISRVFDLPRGFYVAALIASVAIDVDHIPFYLGLTPPHGRPSTHSLATVLVVLCLALVSRHHRPVLYGAATGLILHFARDIAEGPPGVRMLWPLSRTEWTADYQTWLVMIVLLVATCLFLDAFKLPRCRARPFAG